MNKISFREYRTRLSWIEQQLDAPDRHDFYLMQIAAEIRQSSTGKQVNINKMRLKFGEDKKGSEETATIWSKLRWGAILGRFGKNNG